MSNKANIKPTDPAYFLSLEIMNLKCFKNTKLDLSDGKGNWAKWTVLLGDNGTGKTTLLQTIYYSFNVKMVSENWNTSTHPIGTDEFSKSINIIKKI